MSTDGRPRCARLSSAIGGGRGALTARAAGADQGPARGRSPGPLRRPGTDPGQLGRGVDARLRRLLLRLVPRPVALRAALGGGRSPCHALSCRRGGGCHPDGSPGPGGAGAVADGQRQVRLELAAGLRRSVRTEHRTVPAWPPGLARPAAMARKLRGGRRSAVPRRRCLVRRPRPVRPGGLDACRRGRQRAGGRASDLRLTGPGRGWRFPGRRRFHPGRGPPRPAAAMSTDTPASAEHPRQPALPGLAPVIPPQPRLRVTVTLATLADGDRITFPRLQELAGMTAGNLATHLRKLEDAGYVRVTKAYRRRTPVTWLSLTPAGRLALEEYTAALRTLLASASQDPDQHDKEDATP